MQEILDDYEIISSKPCHLCQKIEKKYECDQKIEGCFSNVMGLSLPWLRENLY